LGVSIISANHEGAQDLTSLWWLSLWCYYFICSQIF